MKTAFKQNNQ